ncbi:MAG: hypothetical protein ACOY0T_18520 [Myxococcota bacterium]
MRAIFTGSLSALVLCALLQAGCAERHAGVQAASSERAPNEPVASAARPPAPVPTPSASVQTAPVASAATAASSEPTALAPPNDAGQADAAEPPLVDSDGKTLPQTEERPRVDSPAFKRRIERLARAIVSDDASAALSTFFPLPAYREVKAVEKPERDYQYRLIRHFERDIHDYHKALGPDAASAKFEGIDVPESSARWMKPGSEGNKLGYYRVLRSRLRFTKANGKPHTFELTSMISWRGEWYVVHLHGFE